MEVTKEEDISGPSSLSSDQASLCVIPDPDDSSEEDGDGFIYLDKSSLPASLHVSEQDRTVVVFHSVDEEYRADRDVVCQYIRPERWEETWKDAIYLFKVGWVTHHDFICAVAVSEPNNDPIGNVVFAEHMLPKDTTNLYQFCYLRDYTLLGASTPFQFILPDGDSTGLPQDRDLENDKMIQKGAKSLSCSCISGFSENVSNNTNLETVQSCLEDKAELCCEDAPKLNDASFGITFLNAVYKSLEGTGCCSDVSEGTLVDFNAEPSQVPEELTVATPQKEALCNDSVSKSTDVDQEKQSCQRPSENEVLYLKLQLEEANEEKKWFQEQYNSLLIAMKKYAEDLAAERTEKDSLCSHMSNLTISHKMLCSENARLNNELETTQRHLKEQAEKDVLMLEKKQLEDQLLDVFSKNQTLAEEVANFQSQIQLKKETIMPVECKCDKYMKEVEDLTARLSDYEVMKNCLEVELEEEIKLGQKRDQYVVQLEQVKVHNLQMASNWLASTPNSSTNGNTLLEMEENVNSTLEALECALKEMEVLRSRIAAINRANRALREDFMQKKDEWEWRLLQQQSELGAQLADLQKQVEDERSAKIALQKEVEVLKGAANKYSETLCNQQEISEAMEEAKREINALNKQRSELDRECIIIKEKFASGDIEENVNNALLRNLEEAREEYKKLYTEKIRIQDKLARLQQKIKTKKSSRANQDTAAVDTEKADFMNNVSSSWRAIVDELM